MKNTFKVYCEGDIERFSLAMKDMVKADKPVNVTVKCPNSDWPFIIMDMVSADFDAAGMEEKEDAVVDIVFAPDVMYGNEEWEENSKELQERIEAMDDDELADFLDELLDDLDDRNDEDSDEDNSEGAD